MGRISGLALLSNTLRKAEMDNLHKEQRKWNLLA